MRGENKIQIFPQKIFILKGKFEFMNQVSSRKTKMATMLLFIKNKQHLFVLNLKIYTSEFEHFEGFMSSSLVET